MRPYLQALLGLGAVALLTANCTNARTYRFVAEPSPEYARNEVMVVEPVKRYKDGKTLDLNRLKIDLSSNKECESLRAKYAGTANDVLNNNLSAVLVRYPSDSVFQQGVLLGTGSIINLALDGRDSSWVGLLWSNSFTRESAEKPATLMKLGRELYENACDDPE